MFWVGLMAVLCDWSNSSPVVVDTGMLVAASCPVVSLLGVNRRCLLSSNIEKRL
jgi:hypothetical protein